MKDTAQPQGPHLGQQHAEPRSSQRAMWAEGTWVLVLFAAAEDTFFYHSSNFSMSFNLGSICSLESTFWVPFWVPVEKGSALILNSFRISSLNHFFQGFNRECQFPHPSVEKSTRQSTGIPKLLSLPLCSQNGSMTDHGSPGTVTDRSPTHTFPTSQHMMALQVTR